MNTYLDRDFVAFVELQLEDPPGMRPGALSEVLSRVPTTTQRRRRGWPASVVDGLGPISGATRYAVAAVVVALFGGFLLVTQTFDRPAVPVPGAETPARGLPPITGPAGNGLIAFARDGDIVVGDPATGESEVIVDGEKGFRPLFSPDGTHIAFLRIRSFSPEGPCDIVVIRADGSDERVITPTDDGVVCIETFIWAPDNRGVVFEDYREHPVNTLLLLDASGVADPISLPLSTEFGTDATFLRPPDGDRLLVWGGAPTLGVMDLDGGDVVDLSELSGLEAMGYDGFADPGWSPDGSRIAVLARAGDDVHLYVMESDGSDLRRLAAIAWDGNRTLNPSWSWSPDGSTIAVQHERLVEYSPEACPGETGGDPCADAMWINLIDVESGEERVLDATYSPGMGDGAIWDWSWSPDGQSILLNRVFYPEPSESELVDVETDATMELPWDLGGSASWQRIAAD